MEPSASLKARLNSAVLTCLLKAQRDRARRASRKREFQGRLAITEKAWCLVPTILASLTGRTISRASRAKRIAQEGWLGGGRYHHTNVPLLKGIRCLFLLVYASYQFFDTSLIGKKKLRIELERYSLVNNHAYIHICSLWVITKDIVTDFLRA